MLSSVSDSLEALFPAVALLFLVIYLFAIVILQGVVNHIQNTAIVDDSTHFLHQRYGSVIAAVTTLFLSISNGISWHECYEPLAPVGHAYQAVFLTYILFVNMGVLNIVTGIFVDTVQQMYKPAREEIIEKEAQKRKIFMDEIVELFMEADLDNSGSLTWEEFEEHLADERIRIYFESLQLDASQAKEIFMLMDGDDSGEVGIVEFVEGFLSLKGNAKSVDVWLLKRHTKRLLSKFHLFVETFSQHIAALTGNNGPVFDYSKCMNTRSLTFNSSISPSKKRSPEPTLGEPSVSSVRSSRTKVSVGPVWETSIPEQGCGVLSHQSSQSDLQVECKL
jgi:hypothetical protein